MAIPTHCINLPLISWEVFVGQEAGRRDMLRYLRISGDDGQVLMLLHALPRPGWSEDFTRSELREVSNYIQAGGKSDRMTVEVRKATPDGERQFTVGRRLPSGETTAQGPENVVHAGKAEVRLFDSELFELEEAADLFEAYFRTGDIPDGYVLRAQDILGD